MGEVVNLVLLTVLVCLPERNISVVVYHFGVNDIYLSDYLSSLCNIDSQIIKNLNTVL